MKTGAVQQKRAQSAITAVIRSGTKNSGLIGQAERYPLSGRQAGQCSAGKTVKRGGTVMRGGAKKESKRSAGKHAVQRRKCIAGKYAGNAVHLHLSKPRAAHHAEAITKATH